MKKTKFTETRIVQILTETDAGRMYADLALENAAMKGLITKKL